MTANLFNVVWALYDDENEHTQLLDGQLTDWCAFNNINPEELILDSHQGLLHKGRWQVYNTSIPSRYK